jgi:hypothetical protein
MILVFIRRAYMFDMQHEMQLRHFHSSAQSEQEEKHVELTVI